MRRAAIVAGTVVLAISAAAVVATIVARPRSGRILVEGTAFPAAMVGLPDGSLLYGERLTGMIRAVEPDGQLRPGPVAQVDVSGEGQRGLLGLARAGPDLYAAWTEPGGRIIVGHVAPGPPRIVWEGPPSARLANGGHIEVSLDGDLLIGIGDLLHPELIDDPKAPNGKILALDPDGPPDQEPRVVSGGWNNPFAFDVGPGGELWVADNEPGDDPERLVRVAPDGSPGPVTELPPDTAPSGLALVDGSLVVCGFRSGLLLPYRISGERAVPAGDPVVEDCKIGVTVRTDGEIAYARTDAILVVAGG